MPQLKMDRSADASTLKQADGSVVPAANAIVDVFRWDLPGDFELKANKSGEFVHAGLPLQGNYVVAVSLPGAQAYYLPNVKPGRDEDIKIESQSATVGD